MFYFWMRKYKLLWIEVGLGRQWITELNRFLQEEGIDYNVVLEVVGLEKEMELLHSGYTNGFLNGCGNYCCGKKGSNGMNNQKFIGK